MAPKTPISSIEEYNALYTLWENAKDRIASGIGMGYSGVHYEVEAALNRHNISANSRNQTVVKLKELLNEYEKANFGGQTEEDRFADQADEEK